MLRLFDTARGGVFPVETRDEGKVSMYVCGPTVYAPPHLGHGRFSLVFDVLRRYLEWSGNDVRYVSNITDIDDNIIQRADDEGRTSEEVVAENEKIWYDAMDRLGVKRPTEDPHATQYVDGMVEFIGRLIADGHAYETDDGVYMSPAAVSDYGLLARQTIESLQAGARIDVDSAKRSPVDFALWKKAKPGEPTWPAPWGDGRPGWHTECVVMALDLLGEGFDIHGGGQDLAFPHHENERAQAVAAGHNFARHWVHNGFVERGGEKMSKSLGNVMSLVDVLDRYDARSYRLLILQAHYRKPVEITKNTLENANAALVRLDTFARRTAELMGTPEAVLDTELLDQFRAAMDDDLNTPAAFELVFRSIREGNTALDMEDYKTAAPLAATVRELASAVGLDLIEVVAESDGPSDEIKSMMRGRDDARAAKEWQRADEIRDALQAEGWIVEDTPQGTAVRKG